MQRKRSKHKQKGQLFIVAIVFMIGFIFIAQSIFFKYSQIENKEPFEAKDIELFENIVKVINETIKKTYNCDDAKDSFDKKMEKLKNSLLEEYGKMYLIEINYDLNCSNWLAVPPSPGPLNATIIITGKGRDVRGTFQFYHI